MPIEFPEPLQNFGYNNQDLMERWLNQFATVTNDLPNNRIRMPAMLTSDNMSTWLSTRYANQCNHVSNKCKARELGSEVDSKIRQQRKKSSSGRSHNDESDSEGYFNWLTPKRAKMVENDTNACMKTSLHSSINSDEPVENALIRSVSSEPSDLIAPFNDQTCQMTNNDWFKEYRSASNLNETSFGGLLAPYFEQTGNMKVDDWLARSINASQDSSLSEWLHCAYRSTSEQSSGCVTPTTSSEEFSSSIKSYAPQVDENCSNKWLANEASLAKLNDRKEASDVLDDDDESLLDGLEGMNIGCNSPDNNWLSSNPASDRSPKSELGGNWFLDDYGSFCWTKPKASAVTNPRTGGCISDTTNTSQGLLASSDRSSPFNLNDWLIVADSQTDENSTDDGSSIVVLSIHD